MAECITVDGRPFILPYTPLQNKFFWEIEERFRMLPKGRRFGGTKGATNYTIESMIEGKNGLWIDTVQNNLDAYFSLYFLPELRKIKPEFWKYRSQHKDLNILNARLDMRSAEKPQNIEGFAYDFIIINEAGIVLKGQKGRDLWFNTIYPMVLDFHATVLFIGTPKGKKAKKDEAPHKTSLYYELCLKGGLEDPDHNPERNSTLTLDNLEDPDVLADDDSEMVHRKEENWYCLQVTSYDNPLLDPVDIEEMEADVPRVVRKQEIRGCFINVGDNEIFHEKWFPVVYQLPPIHQWIRKVISMDTAFKKGSENDDSALGCFLETSVGYFILDFFVKKMEFPELLKKAKEFYLKHQQLGTPEDYVSRVNQLLKPHHAKHGVDLVLIEDKASGTPLLQMFQTEFPYPLQAICPITDKVNRAVAVTPTFESGLVSMLYGVWNDAVRDQMCDFNARLDTPDDIVDSVTQFFNWANSSSSPNSPIVSAKPKERKSDILKGY